tara:strand:+ start:481 stop:696 length:216 start_codon:yes stop_codon:yes gene_type:complete
MKPKNIYYYTLIMPLMILIAFLGLTLRDNNKKNFYLPIGIIGFYLVAEQEYSRRTNRGDILNKIKNFQKNK